MNRPMDDDVLDLLGAYALGAVDDDERALVEDLLARSPAARAELARYEHALAGLSDAEATTVTPAGSWDRLRAALHDTARAGAGSDGLDADDGSTDRSADREAGALPPLRLPPREPEGAADVVVPLRPRLDAGPGRVRRSRRVRPRVGALLAAAAVVVVAVVGGVAVGRGRDDRGEAAARAWAAGDSVRGQVASADGAVSLRAVVSARGDGFLYAGDLPRLPAGRTYQLWSLDGAAPVSLGVLGNRPGLVMFATGDQVRALAVSVETSPGAASPTLPPVASGTLS